MTEPTYVWVSDITRTVNPNSYYRFTIVVPGATTTDELFNFLEQHQWEVKSLGAPPPELAEAVMRLVMAGLQAPKAFWVHATWKGGPTTIPDHDQLVYYGPIELLVRENPEQVQEQKKYESNYLPTFLTGVVAGSLAVTIWNYSRK